MTHKVIDNFLEESDFIEVKKILTDKRFNWCLCDSVARNRSEENPQSENSSYYFVHMFFQGWYVSEFCPILSKIVDSLECKSIIRIKANLYPSTKEVEYHEKHADYTYEHKGAIFYINTNDGFTVLENDVKIESVENRLLLFEPHKLHQSSTCTNQPWRMNINFNYF